ncbi:MAG: glycosyltransferase family 4 protein [Saprospiraceae bacterium]|nr:glycosyltransferase family 4 protein [Saprospiraceae bacterium]
MTHIFLTDRFPPTIDGVGDYSFFLAAELARQGQPVHVICSKQPQISAPAGVSVQPVVERWGSDTIPVVLDLVQKIRPDRFILQYVPYGFDPLGLPFFLPKLLRQIRRAGVRTCVMFHEVHIRPGGLKGWLIGNLQRHIARRLCRHADTVVTSNEFYQEMLAPFHSDIRVIPVGANVVVEPQSEIARRQIRKTHLSDASFVVATFGKRDISALKRAVGGLREEGVGLLVCGATPPPAPPPEGRGDVEYTDVYSDWAVASPLSLGGGAGGGVAYTGHLSPTELASHLQCADLFVLPDPVTTGGEGGTSLKSGSLAAAFAAWLPVVGIRGDMSREPLRHGENIWLAENGDAETLHEVILRLKNESALREKLRMNGKILYQEHLRWEVIAGEFLNLLTHPTTNS